MNIVTLLSLLSLRTMNSKFRAMTLNFSYQYEDKASSTAEPRRGPRPTPPVAAVGERQTQLFHSHVPEAISPTTTGDMYSGEAGVFPSPLPTQRRRRG